MSGSLAVSYRRPMPTYFEADLEEGKYQLGKPFDQKVHLKN